MTARKKHRGFNLIEAAIVLGVVGLVIGGIWVAAASVIQNQRVNKTVAAFGQIYAGVRNLFKGQQIAVNTVIYQIGMNTTIIDAGIVPADLVTNGQIVLSDYTYLALVRLQPGGGVIPPTLRFSLQFLKESECINILARLPPMKDDIYRFVGNNTYYGYQFPLSLTTIEAECSSPTTYSLEFKNVL